MILSEAAKIVEFCASGLLGLWQRRTTFLASLVDPRVEGIPALVEKPPAEGQDDLRQQVVIDDEHGRATPHTASGVERRFSQPFRQWSIGLFMSDPAAVLNSACTVTPFLGYRVFVECSLLRLACFCNRKHDWDALGEVGEICDRA